MIAMIGQDAPVFSSAQEGRHGLPGIDSAQVWLAIVDFSRVRITGDIAHPFHLSVTSRNVLIPHGCFFQL
ncbi:hypothetical protein B5K11_15140 [Rhizobium leguminosarum bv. trifolii]|nr:hypothetical protein B5K11_15140 [Rhizobium leguminosarum bv. trifolii]